MWCWELEETVVDSGKYFQPSQNSYSCGKAHIYQITHNHNHGACVHAESFQPRLILGEPMDCSPPGSSVHGILQARIREWVPMPSSRGSSLPRDQECVSCVARGFFTTSSTWKLIAVVYPMKEEYAEAYRTGKPDWGVVGYWIETRIGCCLGWKGILGFRSRMCKGPEMGRSSAYSRNRRRAGEG